MAINPPRPKMPALNALRAFEAAARLGSFTYAAEELFVTPGAIAQHVKSLEAWTGEKLFKRLPQGLELTALGASVLADFIAAFDQLGLAVHNLRTNAAPREIRIAALPSVAQLWLSPRLPGLREAMPEIAISVTALENPPNLNREPFDLAIFYEDPDISPLSIVLSQDLIFPVCAPSIASRLKIPADLAEETLLHDMTWQNDWEIWLLQLPSMPHLKKSGPTFSLYALALEEAKNGAGILMGHEALVQSQLDSGTLVALFDMPHRLQRSLTIKTAKPIIVGSVLDETVAKLISLASKAAGTSC
ncbi:LysR substrate-binding domain-containing protein [Sneathiella marina]|uniref:LysR substrate-binding domain-containing protein n=1 Tax=Sneathiella marina TaxID=2950108 RepID=A0ABY4W3T6_9PROT|nr:LysR family transcriptional regulator [Sneathiella marina]USG61486.1 LysR substrate-binding domain-containing protein [Sneathiella marina]